MRCIYKRAALAFAKKKTYPKTNYRNKQIFTYFPHTRTHKHTHTHTHTLAMASFAPNVAGNGSIRMVHRHPGVDTDAEFRAALTAILKSAMTTADVCKVKTHTATKVVLAKTKKMENAAMLKSLGVKMPSVLEFEETWYTETDGDVPIKMCMNAVVDLGLCVLTIDTTYTRENASSGGASKVVEAVSTISITGLGSDPVIRSILVSNAQSQFKKDRSQEAMAIAEAVMPIKAGLTAKMGSVTKVVS